MTHDPNDITFARGRYAGLRELDTSTTRLVETFRKILAPRTFETWKRGLDAGTEERRTLSPVTVETMADSLGRLLDAYDKIVSEAQADFKHGAELVEAGKALDVEAAR